MRNYIYYSAVVLQVGRFEDFKPDSQRNIPEDQYPESIH